MAVLPSLKTFEVDQSVVAHLKHDLPRSQQNIRLPRKNTNGGVQRATCGRGSPFQCTRLRARGFRYF